MASENIVVNNKLQAGVLPIYMTPALTADSLKALLNIDCVHSFVFMCYGAGNLPQDDSIKQLLLDALKRGKNICYQSQCPAGTTEAGKYAASVQRIDPAIINLSSMTIEAASAKLMWAAANVSKADFKHFMETNQRGEL